MKNLLLLLFVSTIFFSCSESENPDTSYLPQEWILKGYKSVWVPEAGLTPLTDTTYQYRLESDGTFDVYILTASAVKLKLSFSATGVFIDVKVDDDTHSEDHSPIAVADLSADILSYITTNYPNATILAAHNESEGGFEVYVQTATGTKLEIKFTAAGVFVKAEKKN